MTRALQHLRHNLVAYLALFVALGGTSYAATSLPANSVGARQLRNGSVTAAKLAKGAVTPAKLDSKAIGGSVVRWAYVNSAGTILGGSRGARASAPKTTGQPYHVSWGSHFPRSCAVLASSPGTEGTGAIADRIGVHVNEPAAKRGTTVVWAWPSSDGAFIDARFYLAVIC